MADLSLAFDPSDMTSKTLDAKSHASDASSAAAVSATASVKGKVELATVAEVNTGTDASRAVTPDTLAGSVHGEKGFCINVFDSDEDVVVGNGVFAFTIPASMNGMNLVDVIASVHTKGVTGTTDIQIRRRRGGEVEGGRAALTYDTGSAGGGDIPDVGDAVTGGASGATGKIMSITIVTGTFAGNNATGVIQLGATTGCFNDDEALAFTDGETAIVNQPDGAVGADKTVKNGAFVHDNDPPNDWVASAATLSTEVGGQVGNCLMVTDGGTAWGYGRMLAIVEVGKLYKFSAYFKIGTAASGRIYLDRDNPGQFDYKSFGVLTDVAWTQYTHVFEAATVAVYISLLSRTVGETCYFDEVTLYEIRSTDEDMLSTKITIGDEYHASDEVINAANDDVQTGDLIYIDVDAIHTTAPKGLSVTLSFRLP